MVEWSKIPVGARRGPCPNPACTVPRCLDPFVTVSELEGDPYTGPLVALSYSNADGRTMLRLNGDRVEFEVPGPDTPERQDAWIHAVVEPFGSMALDVVFDHLRRRALRAGLLVPVAPGLADA